MARPRKPTNVLQLTGTANPGRLKARAAEPQATGPIGKAPACCSKEVAACWDEIVELAHEGTLCTADRLILEHLAHLLSRLRETKWKCDTALLLRYEAGLARLGLSPADRSKINVLPSRSAVPERRRPAGDYLD